MTNKLTQQELLARMRNRKLAQLELCRKKNSDYSKETDPYYNFRKSESYGGSVEHSIMGRISDKMSRLETYIKKGKLEVEDESVLDTLDDLSNYADLLAIYLENKTQDDEVV